MPMPNADENASEKKDKMSQLRQNGTIYKYDLKKLVQIFYFSSKKRINFMTTPS